MRVLCATTANDGHFGPLVPFARACVEAGHEVRVAAPALYATAVERAGFRHEPFADAPRELIGPLMARLPHLPFEEADALVIREVFGRVDAQAGLPALVETMDRWRPDVVMRESAELASVAAAERAGVPHVHVSIGMHEVVAVFEQAVADPLEELDRLVGLKPGRLGAALANETILSSVPEELDLVCGDDAPQARPYLRFHEPDNAGRAGRARRDQAGSAGRARRDRTGNAGRARRDQIGPAQSGGPPILPTWGDPAAPLVYVTFGSVAGSLPPFAGVFRVALDALADVQARVLLTVGRKVDPAALGPLPPNAHVAQWLPQSAVLEQAAATLGHGGFGTTMGALAAGVPQAVAPLFTFDQVVNARHVAAAGAGLTQGKGLDSVERAAEQIPRLLQDPSYAAAARSVAAAMAALPPPADAVPVLVGLAGGL